MTEKEEKPKPAGYVFGRPTSYKPEYCQQLVDHMSQGLSFESFAAIADVDKGTLYEWSYKHEDFGNARKKAIDNCRLFWEKMGVKGADGKIPGFNPAAWIFNMKNRFANEWRDKTEVEQSGAVLIGAVTREQMIELCMAAQQEKLVDDSKKIALQASTDED